METEGSDASNPYSVEGDSLLLDLDLYDADSYDIPDPGLLKEKNGVPRTAPARTPLAPLGRCTTSPAPRPHPPADCRPAHPGPQEKRGELCVARLTHGLEPLRHLKVAAGLCSVAQDPVGRRFVVLDGAGHLHVHREDGWAYEKLQAPAALTGLVAVPGPLDAVSRFVGWGPQGLAILRPDLSLLWLSKPGVGRVPGHEPLCCLPVPGVGLMLVAEAGGRLVLWKFCSGGRRLVPCGSPLQLPPSPAGTLTRLALGPLHSHQVPRCFAAYGSAVLTFDLHTWALVDVRRDLHKSAILDLAYCLEAEAMVTASRDSTVKVWEADWRIRMVFMGHTGPVTALAVLPNTSLVLSASQDGTLRTWDLQAAAQVGEVALNCWGRDVASGRVNRLLAPAGPSWPVLSLSASSVELWRLRELYSPLAQLSAPVLHVQVVPALPAPPHPLLPVRLVCACADGSVYLVSVATGRTVSALLLEPDDCAASVLYCLPREALWLLTRAGHLVCASAARCPMRVLHRVCPPPAPAPRPCCLHLYSHLPDPGSAVAGWETVCRHGGEPRPSDAARARKDKNRWVPEPHGGRGDGARAHGRMSCAGGDSTVKMWRVYPYAEDSLSLLRTFSCGRPAVGLCALGKRITAGFEDPDSATYGLVQFGPGDSPRCEHRPQDDPTDHITGLCCCPTLELYACSSLDCTVRIWTAENRLLRLLQLNGAPQGLTFSSNSGDLVLALGSRLCLVSHKLYLPTSYLVKNLCQKVPDVVHDPPLPLTSQESLTSAQLQRLANLHGVASLSPGIPPPARGLATPTPRSLSQHLPNPTSDDTSVPPVRILVCSTDSSFIHRQTATPQQPVLEEDLEALVARDQDLQQLSLGLVVPAAQPPPSWHERQEAFDNYLHLIYGPGLLVPLLMKRRPKEPLSNFRGFFPATIRPYKEGACGPRSAACQRPPGLSPVQPGRRQDDLWLPRRIRRCAARWQQKLTRWLGEEEEEEEEHRYVDWSSETLSPPTQLSESEETEAQVGTCWGLGCRGRRGAERRGLQLLPPPQNSEYLTPKRAHSRTATRTETCFRHPWHPYGHSLWEERYGHLPRFLHFFVGQNWFKKLFPIFTLEGLSTRYPQAYPEVSTVEGLASLFVDLLYEASWADCVHILKALLRLLPDLSGDLRNQLQGVLVRQLNLDQPPSLEDQTQKQFVMLALQLLLACSLESREVVLELMSYFLYSPASRRPELRKLLDGLGLQDPQGFLFREMMTWVQGPDADSKAALRKCCCQKLEEMIQRLQVLGGRGGAGCLQWSLLSCPPPTPPPAQAFPRSLRGGAGDPGEAGRLFALLCICASGVLSCPPTPHFWGSSCSSPGRSLQPDLKLGARGSLCPGLGGTVHRLLPPQTEHLQPSVAKLSEMLPKVSQTSVFPSPPKETLSRISGLAGSPHVSGTPSVRSRVPSPGELNLAVLESGAKPMPSPARLQRTRRALSEALLHFCPSEVHLRSSAPAALQGDPLLLEQTDWSRSQMLDLGPIDALNFFCEQQRARQQGLPREELERLRLSPCPPESNTVLPQPRDHWHYPILRLQEAKVQRSPMRLRGWMRSQLWVGRTLSGSIRMLKLPLPRVEVQPFPPDWPRPARPLPPRLLQPTLQRYFLPDYTDPDSYS
ncbi:hypothetical protein GH733_008211 [Mirounga leonina]|nr:hypothetical protein GH733_008211 [Mirounga leonina]